MQKGYIKLWRKIQDNDLWLREKFTRGQAWVDLLMLANHKEGYIRIRGCRIDLKRGQLAWSETSLARRWRWSRKKVRNFLQELAKSEQQIEQQKNNVTSLITIINYNEYQSQDTTKGTTKGTAKEPQKNRKGYTDNNDKNDKNEKNEKNIRKNACQWPDEFCLNDEMKKYAIDNGIDPERLEDFFQDFHDWSLSKGAKYKDWEAAFRTRVRRAREYGKQYLRGDLEDNDRFRRMEKLLNGN